LFDHPHLRAVGMFDREVHPTEGELNVARSPFRVAGEPSAPDRPAPVLGQDTFDILREAGVAEAAIELLFARGAAAAAGREVAA
jgi:crotonobetainyl-CoA:carnitine CoA-transferase CaiB-like acyl-CoA transferase